MGQMVSVFTTGAQHRLPVLPLSVVLQCEGGVQERIRNIKSEQKFGGAECSDMQEERTCNEDVVCPVDCQLSSWSVFSSCTKVAAGCWLHGVDKAVFRRVRVARRSGRAQ